MGILDRMLGGSVKGAVEAVTDAIDTFVETPEEKQAAKVINEKLRQRPGELQVELNKIEAGHRSIFVAGWRPFIGWVCGIGLGFTFLINPILQWYTGDPGPTLATDVMLELIVALLGLGTLRTIEKLQGRSK